MGCIIGIDYGTKRIGLAVGDVERRLASPLSTVGAQGDVAAQAQAVLQYADAYDVDAFVVGLPLNMDDTEGPQAKTTRRFGDQLARIAAAPVHYWDERLSTFAADELLDTADLSRAKRKSLQDAIAAQVILQGFLDAQPGPTDPPESPLGKGGGM